MTLGMAFVDSWAVGCGWRDGGCGDAGDEILTWFCLEFLVSPRSLAARGIFMDDHS